MYLNGQKNAVLYSDPDDTTAALGFRSLQAAGTFPVPNVFINESALVGFTLYDPHGFDPAATAYDHKGNKVTMGLARTG